MQITANWEQAAQPLLRLFEVTREEERRIIGDLVILGERVARETVRKDTSNLARSIFSDATDLMGVVAVPGGSGTSSIGQAATQEFGRGAGKAMPPPEALRGWAQRHGFDLSGKDGGRGVLFVLARSIGRKGYEGAHYMQAAADAMKAALPKAVEEAATHIRERMAS